MNVLVSAAVSEATIRPARPGDAPALVVLVAQLGYPTDEESLRTRLASLTAAGDLVLAAEYQGAVIGLVHLHQMPFLHRPADGRVVTLAVAAEYRSRGLGAQLLRAAEHTLLQWGCGRVEVTSGTPREAAHRFYRREGYEEQSKRFVKQLGG